MNILKYKNWYLIFSLILLIPGIISLGVYGLNLAVDFTGGSVFKYELEQIDETKLEEVKNTFKEKGLEIDTIIKEENNSVTVRTKPTDAAKNTEIKNAIVEKIPEIQQVSFETVGPSVGAETTKKSFIAVGIASVGILLYIAFAFRDVPKPYSSFKFGVSAIFAMLHDAFVVLGIFSILGHFLKVQIDSLFITAVLTVIGFSVHDTIVVFDRIRENLKKLPSTTTFEDIANYSLVETLNRSFATSLTVIITLLALFLLGGESIKYFVLALLIGIVSGTYSSIFTATPVLVIWESRRLKKAKKHTK